MAFPAASAGPFAFCRNSSRRRHIRANCQGQIVPHRETRHEFWRLLMRKTILAALAVLAIGGATTGIVVAQAQPAPPAPDAADPPPQRGMGWMHRGHDWHQRDGMMQRLRAFALVYPQKDRKLTPPDV